MDELKQAFVQESAEQLENMEDTLLLLEKNPADPEAINTLFRSAHTIKGAAGVIECDFIVKFTHVQENVLDVLRDGEIQVSPDLIALLLQCKDHLGALLAVVAADQAELTMELDAQSDRLAAQLKSYLPTKAGLPETVKGSDGVVENLGGNEVGHDCWHISVRFGSEVMKHGMDPLAILRYLATLGEIAHLTTLVDTMPHAAEMDSEACYLGFEIDLRSSVGKAAIERVFDFVHDECLLKILPPFAKVSEYLQLIDKLPEDSLRLGEILVKCGALTEEELAEGLAHQNLLTRTPVDADDSPETPHIGAILVDQQVVQKEIVEAAVAKQTLVSEKKTQESKLIRVQADKLDHLINLVGELVIAGASAALLAQKSKDVGMFEATSTITRLVDEIRDGALRLRMVQIGETFNRFHRVVRDVARELDKDIDLVITGAETELDKTVVEKINDPLMHLVRNALDHGIEPKATRVANGKPEKGTVRLNAFHESGSIVIEVSDDGGGLKKDRILAKAVEKGLVAEGAELSDQEIYKLIFEPGFSTVEQVSNLSGRGVGMDVVRRNIESLRGTVHIESEPGEGTNLRIRLPLTLAIIDGFLTGVGDAAYVVPLDLVEECIELSADLAGRNYLNLRGEVLPFIHLRAQFAVTEKQASGSSRRRQSVVVVRYAGKRAGLVVDELMGEFQTVIKPLGPVFAQLKGIAGSTILGTGEVALILDVPNLIALTTNLDLGAERLNLAA
jgi:two-component system, chemotaxis family, sensor kinase CheA